MKEFFMDLAIVGGGPAGLAAALEAKKHGISNIIILERDNELGGILQQCIHDGFGLHRFKSRLSGGQYAQRFIDELKKTDVLIKTHTTVIEITENKTIYACNPDDGILKIHSRSIILAMGCRERTASQLLIYGSRPAGVLTAGTVQRYINMEGYLPGKQAVILGSGDIGLIMARRMTLEGIIVKGVYEIAKTPGGLTRNIVQCLDDYNIPLHLSSTVTQIHGKNRVEGVTVARVDENHKPIKASEEYIPCDLLVLAAGLIPENELSAAMGIEMDPTTNGPVLDSNFMTNKPGVFAAGNVAVVFDLVDYVSISGEIAARGAARYLQGRLEPEPVYQTIEKSGNINIVLPQRYSINHIHDSMMFFLRVKEYSSKSILKCYSSEKLVYSKNYPAVTPSQMLFFQIPPGNYKKIEVQLRGI